MIMLAVSQWRQSRPIENDDGLLREAGYMGPRLLVQHLGMMVAYAAILICLTVGQLWPALEFTALSVRSARPFHELSSGFPPQDIWQLVVPGVLSLYSPLYVGISGLGLAAVATGALLWNRFSLIEGGPFARPARSSCRVGCVFHPVSSWDLLPVYPLLHRFAPGCPFPGAGRVAYLFAFSLSV